MTDAVDTPETSVMFSLAELADIEEQRVQEEAHERARRQAEQARRRALTLEEQRKAEELRVAATQAEREQRALVRAQEEAKRKAHEHAAFEVARIEAEAKARLEADNAARAHELAVLQVKEKRGGVRLRRLLAAALGLVVVAGSGAAFAVNGHLQKLEQQSQQLRDDRWALVQKYDKQRAAELMELDRRHEALIARSEQATSKQTIEQAAAARAAIEAGGADGAKLLVFGKALAQLQASIDRGERLADQDRRLADLTTWAKSGRKSKLADKAQDAAARAHRSPDDDRALAAYDGSLDKLRGALGTVDGPRRPAGAVARPDPVSTGTACTTPGDPLCTHDGKLLGAP